MEESNGTYKLSIEARITRLETTVEDMKSNHLVHLSDDVQSLSNKLDRASWLTLTVLGGVVADLLLRVV